MQNLATYNKYTIFIMNHEVQDKLLRNMCLKAMVNLVKIKILFNQPGVFWNQKFHFEKNSPGHKEQF